MNEIKAKKRKFYEPKALKKDSLKYKKICQDEEK